MSSASPKTLSAENVNSLVANRTIVSSSAIAKECFITNGYVNQLAKKLNINPHCTDIFGTKYYNEKDANLIASKVKKEKPENEFSVQDIAAATGTTRYVILRAIERVFPSKIQNGIKTVLNKEECTILLDEIKNNKTVKERLPLQSVQSLSSVQTEMTPALKLAQAQQMMQEAYEALLAMERAKVAALTPKAEAYDAITDSRGAISIANTAKVLAFKDIGQNKLFAILRDLHILQNNNIPYQRYIDDGYFRVIEQKYTTPDGETHISFKTLVFQRGVEYIRRQLILNHYVHMEEIMAPEAIEDTAETWLCEQEA